MSQPTLKFYYFGIAGKGEAIRLALTHSGLEFEDVRFDRNGFAKLKETGKLAFGQVPALEVTGADGKSTMLLQSAAILRYVGKLGGGSKSLYPADPLQAALVDALIDEEKDMSAGSSMLKYGARHGLDLSEETKATAAAAIKKEFRPKHLGFVVKILADGGTGWLAGTAGPTIADFVWANSLLNLQQGSGSGDPEVLQGFPTMAEYVQRFSALPSVQKYYADQAAAK